jgi:hypothetical protein
MAVNLSPVGGVAAQFFNNDGVPLAGGLIYTYAAGTNTPAATYTTNAGVIAHSNPIVLDSAGRVPTGEIWLTDGISYKFVLKDSTGALLATYDNIVGINSNFINYTNSQEIQTATAGQTVFTLTTMAYQPGTNSLSVFVDGVNQYGPGAQYAYVETSGTSITFISGLHVGALVKFTTSQINSSSYGDASQIGYTPAGTNAVTTNVQAKLRQTVSVFDYMTVSEIADIQAGTALVDVTAAIQQTILDAATELDVARKIIFPTGRYRIDGTIYVPSNIDIDLCQSTLVGTGSTSGDNIIFNTGYVSGGAIISNFGPPEANRVTFTRIYNGTISTCNIAFNLQNFNEGCEISDIYFEDCGQAVYAFRCFYGSFKNSTVRGINGATEIRGAFQFVSYVNVQKMDSLFVIGRKLAFFLNGAALEGVDGTTMTNCSAEDCEIGVQCIYSLRPLTIQGCYFERCTQIAIDVSNASAQYVSVQGCWFGECVIGFKADYWLNGTFYADNTWVDSSGTGIFVQATSDTSAFATVQIPASLIANNGVPALPLQYQIGKGIKVEYPVLIYTTSTFEPTIRTNFTGGLIDLPYAGDAGGSPTGIAFCATSYSGSSPFYAYVDTKINYGDWVFGVYHIICEDDLGTYEFAGRIIGSTIIEDITVSGKPVVYQTNGNYIRLRFGLFTSTTNGWLSYGGVVRHM